MADLLMKMPIPNEPLKKNRFILRFPSSLGFNEYFVKSASRPSININEIEIPFLNTSKYVAGRYNWDAVNVELRDGIGPSTSQVVMEWVRLVSESLTGRQGYAAGYKKEVEIVMIDPTGNEVQKWILFGAWPSKADFGSLDYGDDEVATISMTLRIDYAELIY